MDQAAFIEALRASDAATFASNYVLEGTPWVFNDRTAYLSWKAELATGMEVDSFALVVVGSACTQFSLTPRKEFREFHELSDVDVAVVSPRHFDEAWRWLRSLGPLRNLPQGFERKMLRWHRENLIFDGTIATERLLPHLSFGPRWASALASAGNRGPFRGRSVKARIYRDYESLRYYHERNIASLKAGLAAEDDEL